MGTCLLQLIRPLVCLLDFSISFLGFLSSTVHSDFPLPQRYGMHKHTKTNRHTGTHTCHAHSQIGRAGVQAVTRSWTDAGLTISIGLSVGNNTLAGFRHETVLTREATLKWSIHYLQITLCSRVCMCVGVCVCLCGCTYTHYMLERACFCYKGAVGWCQCHHQLWDEMFSPKVTSSSLFPFFSPAIMRQQYRTLCRHLCWNIY